MRRSLLSLLLVAVGALGLVATDPRAVPAAAAPAAAPAPTVEGFADVPAVRGLDTPTSVAFAADGRVFIAEKRGIVKVFDNLNDPSPTVVADLRTEVYDFWDRGLSGLALHPRFPEMPYLYLTYSYDFDPRTPERFPRWHDACPTPPGPLREGCAGSGRLTRLTLSGSAVVDRAVLIEDWCIQFVTHSVNDVVFGPDGYLYVSAGDGAHYDFADTGQAGGNPCGDPAGEGGALRAQDIETAGDPVTLDGAVLRIDPLTGLGAPGNPFASHSDTNAQRIIAYGLRNPFRMAFRPGTRELWLGDVGMASTEELNRVDDAASAVATNFGWPCYEGSAPTPAFASAALAVCERLYAEAARVTAPAHAYDHEQDVAPADGCPRRGSSITGTAFYGGGAYPPAYRGALFFADYSRECIWVARAGPSGRPDMATVERFIGSAAGPVDLEIGPGGDLFYVALNTGELRRVAYRGTNRPPVASVSSSAASGDAPLAVTLSAARSTDPDAGDSLSYAWDLDGDGGFDDAFGAEVTTTLPIGVHTPGVRVTDSLGAAAVARTLVRAGLVAAGALGGSGWQLNGAARAGACGVELTPMQPRQRGSAVWTEPIASSNIAVGFDAVIDTTHAATGGGDGIALAFVDAAAGPGALGFEGGNIGFGGLPGVAVTLDTYRNPTDPYTNFIGVTTGVRPGGGLDYAATASAGVPPLAGATTRVEVALRDNGALAVFAAGRLVLETTVALPPLVRVAFTSATGGEADRHEVCNATVTMLAPRPGALDIDPPSVDFGATALGALGVRRVHLRNLGTTPVVVGSGALPAPFRVLDPPPAGTVIPPGRSRAVHIGFLPSVVGVASAELTVTPAGGAPATIALLGTGAVPGPPVPVIAAPTAARRWSVGDEIAFHGHARRSDGTPLPASALRWTLVINHCASIGACHQHTVQTFNGVASGSFVAPDHQYPATLELRLSAADGAQVATATLVLAPQTIEVEFASDPPGLLLIVGSDAGQPTPFVRTLIAGAATTIVAPSPQARAGERFEFARWAQGGPRVHTIELRDRAALTAVFRAIGAAPAG